MQLNATYTEIDRQIDLYAHQSIKLQYEKTKEVKASASVSFGPFSKTISITLRVEKVDSHEIFLSPVGLNTVEEMLVKQFGGKIAELTHGIATKEGNQIHVDLCKIKNAEKAFDHLALRDLKFTPEGVQIFFDLL